jgi:hypothetical protein
MFETEKIIYMTAREMPDNPPSHNFRHNPMDHTNRIGFDPYPHIFIAVR